VPAIGPWRGIWVEESEAFALESVVLRPRVEQGVASLEVDVRLRARPGVRPRKLEVMLDGRAWPLSIEAEPGTEQLFRARDTLSLPQQPLWWPHTHGEPVLARAELAVSSDGPRQVLLTRRLGFRSVELRQDSGAFELVVNDVPVFARGACWTPLDPITQVSPDEQYLPALKPLRDAGMNLLRLSGTLSCEADGFYDACDALGILVWQDFMFANMDYPIDDAPFRASVEREARTLMERVGWRPSLALVCGGSEVAQQAAMWGLPRETWTSPLFTELLPEAVRDGAPGVPYVPSTPWGGALPFHADSGVTHYYGVGAYLRPLEDARRANVRFAAECLAFSNVPADESFPQFLNDGERPVHHPSWKRRVPRDVGASWDFEDVRDHYLGSLFKVDAALLRTTDLERYLELSRVVTAELVTRTFAEWRRPGSTCRGGLVWFLRDLWPGAGWGVLEATGEPKAAFYGLKRVFAPVTVLFSDEGVNGLHLHTLNESGRPRSLELRFAAFREGATRVAHAATQLTLPPRGAQSWNAETLLGGFLDTAYAYRFGPAPFDVAFAELWDTVTGERCGMDVFFPLGLPHHREPSVGLTAKAAALPGGDLQLNLTTERFAQSVCLRVPGYLPEDNYFHLAPGESRQLSLHRSGPTPSSTGTALPLNAKEPTTFVLDGPSSAGGAR
jgi:beta-mannosidase